MPFAKVNGVNLYYELHGPQGADVIVLSNGIFMATASWVYQVAAFSKHFRVLLYDCRGMWQSDHPDEPYSMQQHADDLAGLLDTLGIEKAHVGGISYGAEISMIFALSYPERTRSLIVSSAVSQIDPLLRSIGAIWSYALDHNDAELLFNSAMPLNFSESWLKSNQALFEPTRKRYHQMDLAAASRLMAAFSQIDFTDKLKAISCPTLVLVGELDLLKPRKYAEIIASEIPGSELLIIPDGGHAVCLEKPEAFNSAVLGFVLKHSEVCK